MCIRDRNEPVTYAVRKTIEGAVVELVNAGQKKGLWKFKAPEWKDPGVKVIETVTEEELIEEIIEADNEVRETAKEEVYDDYKKKPEVEAEAETTPAPQPEQVKEPVKIEEPISDAIKCESGPHHYRCYEDEKTIISTDTDTDTDR